MIWLNPWAWLGLAALAAPILIHLLGRRRPRPLGFPTLRFLGASRQIPAQRRRIHDVPLLLVRLFVLAVAVAALAQPQIARLSTSPSASVARAIVLDTSESMSRGTATGRPAIDVARERAEATRRESASARVFETPNPRTALPSAIAWLGEQAARRELVVVSDFQVGTIDRADVALVPADVGIRLDTVDAERPEVSDGVALTRGAQTLRPSLGLRPDETSVEWRQIPPVDRSDPSVLALVAPDDRAVLDSVMEAARAEGVPLPLESRPVVVVFPGAPDAARLSASATAVDQPWMYDLMDAVARDAAVETLAAAMPVPSARAGAAATATVAQQPSGPPHHRVIVDSRGLPLVSAGAVEVDGRRRVAFFVTRAIAETPVFAAAVLRAAERAAVDSRAVRELEPVRIPEADLKTWTREPAVDPAAPPPAGDRSEGRWLWALALIALGVETWMRRPGEAAVVEADRARVA